MTRGLLLVEDDADDVELTLLGFRHNELDPDVAVARDGVEALELLEAVLAAGRALPAVIVTDLKMPRMDGLELLRRLKEDPRLRDIPVLVLTSSDHDADVRSARELGASRYLRKPADLDDYRPIVASIREAMAAPGK